jgi:GT2 family glycosyltransferase
MKLSVIIVNRDTKGLLLECLGSLAANVPSDLYEVIIVDNASVDGSPDAVRTSFPTARVIETHENLGFSRSNNLAAKEASGEFLFVLNSDTAVYPQSVQKLIEALDKDSAAGAAGPTILRPNGETQPSAEFLMTARTVLSKKAKRRAKSDLALAIQHNQPLEGLAAFSGAAVLVRKSAFQTIGGFDEAMFFGVEDYDLGRRLTEAGWGMVYVPEATILHHGGSSRKIMSVGAGIESQRGRYIYLAKHHGWLAATAASGVFVTGEFLRAFPNLVLFVLTLGFGRSFGRKARLHAAVFLWLVMGKPARTSWIYRKLFCDWQARRA